MILLKILILSWLITHFTPLKMFVEIIPTKKLNPLISILMSIITLPIYCYMCCSFWVGLIWSHDIIIASMTAFLAFWYDKTLGPIENHEKLN